MNNVVRPTVDKYRIVASTVVMKSITPAQGWYAVFTIGEGDVTETQPLACWALVTLRSDYYIRETNKLESSDDPFDAVVGMIVGDGILQSADEFDNFQTYEYKPEGVHA